jgi:hypothetical protein
VEGAAERRAAAAERLARLREAAVKDTEAKGRTPAAGPVRRTGEHRPSAAPGTPPRTRRQELADSLFGDEPAPNPYLPPSPARDRWEARMNQRHNQGGHVEQEQDRIIAVNMGSGDVVRSDAKAESAIKGGRGDIASMREDWSPHVGRAARSTDDMVASLKQWAAAIENAPVHPSVHEAAMAVVTLAAQLPEKVAAVNALTRQADAVSWQHSEDTANRPNRQAW